MSRKSFTKKQKELFIEVFAFFDKNGDGLIDQSEMLTMMNSLGVKVSQEDLEERMAEWQEFDIDRNGTFDFNEFLCLMKETLMDVQDDERLKEAFALFDLDSNGYIDIKELSEIMKRLGQNLEISQLKAMIYSADIDKDGKINFEEFKRLMNTPS